MPALEECGQAALQRTLLFVVFDFHWLQIFRLEDLTAIEALDVIYAIPAGYNLCSVVFAGGLHTLLFIGFILAVRIWLSSPHL